MIKYFIFTLALLIPLSGCALLPSDELSFYVEHKKSETPEIAKIPLNGSAVSSNFDWAGGNENDWFYVAASPSSNSYNFIFDFTSIDIQYDSLDIFIYDKNSNEIHSAKNQSNDPTITFTSNENVVMFIYCRLAGTFGEFDYSLRVTTN